MPADIDVKGWLLEQPESPHVLVAQLKKAKVDASFYEGWRKSERGRVAIRSTFSKLPIIKEILENAGIKRKRWPRPRGGCPNAFGSRPGACQLRLDIKWDSSLGWLIPLSRLDIKLTKEQAAKLTELAARAGEPLQRIAQKLFDEAIARAQAQP